VNNAGYSVFGGVEMLTLEKMKEQFDTNFFGSVLTMQAVLPHMRAKKFGRILNVSSVGGIWGQPLNDVYCASKFALEGFSESMSSVYSQFGIRVSLIEPGAIKTEFVSNAQIPKNVPQELQPILQKIIEFYSSGSSLGAQTGDEVAAKIVETAESENPPFRVQTNQAIQNIFKLQLADPSGNAGVNLATSTFFANKK